MRVAKTLSLDIQDMAEIEKECEKRNITISEYINLIHNYYQKEIKISEAKIIKCSNCNGKYSNVLKECPNCKTEETIKKQEKNEIENEIENLRKERKNILDEIGKRAYTYNRLIVENRISEAENIKKEMNELNEKLDLIENDLMKIRSDKI